MLLLATSALAAIVLLLLALRLTQRLTLRFKVLAGVSVSRQPEKSCPHLGQAADPFTHASQPSDDHRCYLWMQRDRIDLTHQKGFCLSTAHHKCPWLMMRRPDAPPPLRQRLPAALAASWTGLRGHHLPLPPRRLPLPPRWERRGEGAHAFPGRALAASRAAAQALTARLSATAPRLASVLATVAGALWLATRWSARLVWRLAVLMARTIAWLTPRVAALLAQALRTLARALAEARARRAEARAQALAAQAQAQAAVAVSPAAPALAADTFASEQAPELEPVAPPSLARLEELLAEGLASLDRGQEPLAYHLFAKATEQRIPRGAAPAYADALKRAWFWRAKTAETVDEVVTSLEKALEYEPGNLQMQAHLAWARQRLDRERKLVSAAEATPAPLPVAAAPKSHTPALKLLGTGVRIVGGLMALVLAALWMTTAVMPALGHVLSQLPAGDELLLRRLLFTINATALPGQGHLPLPVVNYDLGLSLPFVMAFAFVFTARGLMDGDGWARTTGLVFAGLGGWLCAAAVTNPDASRLGLGLCLGIIVAAVVGRFESPRRMPGEWVGY